ncbi:Tar ligand binding domain-containing protein [Escherichia coli]
MHHIRLVPLFACILGGILVLFALSSALAGYFLWQADRDQRDVTAEIEIRTGVSEQFRFFAFSPDQYDSGRGCGDRIAEMEAMKRNIAQAEIRIKQSQQGYRAYQNRPVKTPADEALDTELNQRFQAYITGMQPMLKYAKNGMFEAIINHESEQINRWIMLIPIF